MKRALKFGRGYLVVSDNRVKRGDKILTIKDNRLKIKDYTGKEKVFLKVEHYFIDKVKGQIQTP